MIIVQLDGNMGKQMFQYALGRRLALIHKAALKLDLSNFSTDPSTYRLASFTPCAEIAETEDVDKLINLHFLRRSAQSAFTGTAEENSPYLVSIRDNTRLTGICMKENYLRAIRPLLRREFSLKTPPEGLNRHYLNKITKQHAVSIYIRTRYTPEENLVPLSFDYYYRAVEYMAERLRRPVFYVFSDAPEECAAQFSINYPCHFMQQNGEKHPEEDFRLMCSCRHHIISNTELSWWPAWLNPNKKKIVVAPDRWFQDSDAHEDFIPSRWIQLPFMC